MEMLDGITVLNTFEDYYFTFGWSSFALAPIILFGICMVAGIAMVTSGDMDGIGIIFGSIIVGFLLTLAVCAGGKKVIYTTYEVTVDSSVSFQEFDEQYEILKQRGEIYVIKEKE